MYVSRSSTEEKEVSDAKHLNCCTLLKLVPSSTVAMNLVDLVSLSE